MIEATIRETAMVTSMDRNIGRLIADLRSHADLDMELTDSAGAQFSSPGQVVGSYRTQVKPVGHSASPMHCSRSQWPASQ